MDQETLAKLPNLFTLDGMPFKVADENFYDVYSIHNHTVISPDGSKNQTIETLLDTAEKQGITHLIVTDHDLPTIIDSQEHKVKAIRGIEQRTQYYEFNISGMKQDESTKLLEAPKFGKYFDFDSLIGRVDEIRQTNPDLIVGLNHPFSGQLIPGWNKIKKNVREGFEFKKYILDHWDLDRIKDHIELDINLHVSYHDFIKNKLDDAIDPGVEHNEHYQIRKWLSTDKKAYQRLLSIFEINTFVKDYMRGKHNIEKYKPHEEIMKGLMSHFDYVELNTFNYYKKDAKKARQLAEKYNKPIMIGEDAHFEGMVGTKGFNLASNYKPLRESLKIGSVQPVVTELYRNSVLNTLTTAFYRILGGLNKQKKMF